MNGRDCDTVAVQDRGLQYGDGLFETLAIRRGRPRLLDLHMERLAAGCARLGMPMPDNATLRREIDAVVEAPEQVVKVILTRGPAGRGYRAPQYADPTRIVAGFADPPRGRVAGEGVRVRMCRTRLGHSPSLAGLKHLGRLEQVLARSEWRDQDIGEGLMLDVAGNVVCGTQSNLFVLREGVLLTPVLDLAGVAGVMRRAVLRWAGERCMVAREATLRPPDLREAEEVFLTNALVGAWQVVELDGHRVARGNVAAEFNAWLDTL